MTSSAYRNGGLLGATARLLIDGPPAKASETHTQGPWEQGSGASHTVFAPKRKGHQQIIANCPAQHGDIDYDSRIVGANARLIAAAPRLLAALDNLQANPSDPRAHREAIDAMMQARGQS